MLYYLLLAIFYPISYLPFKVLYSISDFLYWVLYKIIKYRVPVTMGNLQRSFPEKTPEEIEAIAIKYYKNLCDSVVETIKLLSISKEELNKRYTCNWDILQQAFDQNRTIVGYLSHQFNWEWGTVAANWNIPYTFIGTYLPITSTSFEKLMYKIRSRSGTYLVTVQNLQKQMTEIQNRKEIVWGFIADQNPSDVKRVLWYDFLHQKTCFAKGAEFIARRYDNMVFFGSATKIKRGYYHLELKLVFDNPKNTVEGEITTRYVQYLEECIKYQPENWVWSHRRWKHTFKESNK